MPDLQVPPSSREAEEAVLGCILMEGLPIYERVAGWIREDNAFYFKDNQMIWKAMKELLKSKEPVDEPLVIAKIKEMHPDEKLAYFITGLRDDALTTANVESYARVVWEKHIQRETSRSAKKLLSYSYSNASKTSDMLDKHSKLVEELKVLHPSKKRDVESIVDEAREYVKSGNNIIPFGFFPLDAPAGGMTRKEVTVIGGRPGHGKTTLIINIIRCLIEQEFKVMLFNREMSNAEMMKKFIVMESKGLSYESIRKANLTDEMTKEFDKTADNVTDKYKKNLIMYDDVRTLNEAMIEISRYKPDVIIDDYIQLIDMTALNSPARRHEIERIMYEYKWVCKKEDCSAILLSQMSREIERRQDPRPRMSDYAESGVIEQTVEAALFLFYGYNFDDQEYDRYETEIIAAKTRYGRIGKCVLGFNGNRCRFYEDRDEAVNDQPLFKEKVAPWMQNV